MDRKDALARLRCLKGRDLRSLAESLPGVTVWTDRGTLNKGWAGHAIERYLGLPLNSSRSPNLGSWELKIVSLKTLAKGGIAIKETMQITMLDPYEVAQNGFENSHVLTKLRKIIAVSRMYEGKSETRSVCVDVNAFELEGSGLYSAVAEDYELIRDVIRREGADALSGRLGKYIQPRTKGPGHGSRSRAFYARKELVEYIIGWKTSPRSTV